MDSWNYRHACTEKGKQTAVGASEIIGKLQSRLHEERVHGWVGGESHDWDTTLRPMCTHTHTHLPLAHKVQDFRHCGRPTQVALRLFVSQRKRELHKQQSPPEEPPLGEPRRARTCPTECESWSPRSRSHGKQCECHTVHTQNSTALVKPSHPVVF
jgi:hypothetical protein